MPAVAAALAAAACAAGYAWRIAHLPMPPLEVSLWYWHSPYRIEPAEVKQLQQIGVKQLFVLAGTFGMEHERVKLFGPQRWAAAPAQFGVQLVFHLDSALIHHFDEIPVQTLAAALTSGIGPALAEARRGGARVNGVQLDFDCPTRLLGRYAELMRRIRASLEHGLELSATALPTWYGGDIEPLMNAVDFLTPQYYEATVPASLKHLTTISSLGRLRSGLRAAGRHDQPFYAGLPCYGHGLLYNAGGELLGVYHDITVVQALRHPALRLDRAFGADRIAGPASRADYIGEDIYDFETIKPDENGRGLAYHLVYDLPTPELLRRYLEMVSTDRPRNCRGIILFRYPEAEERSTLPLTAIDAEIHGRNPAPALRFSMSSAAAPWSAIESRRPVDRIPQDVTVTVTNCGDAGTYMAADAVTVTLLFDGPGLSLTDPGECDRMETLYTDGPESHALSASAARANMVKAFGLYLAPGESMQIGPIETTAKQLAGRWTVRAPGGYETYSGVIGAQVIGGTRKPSKQD